MITTTLRELCVVTICDDCTIWHANGDDSGFCSHADPDDCAGSHCDDVRNAPGLDGWHVPAHSIHVFIGADRDEFSRTPCDLCGERLAGARNDATLLFYGG